MNCASYIHIYAAFKQLWNDDYMLQEHNKYTNNHYTDVCFFQSLIYITYALLYITSNNFTKSSAKQTCVAISKNGQIYWYYVNRYK